MSDSDNNQPTPEEIAAGWSTPLSLPPDPAQAAAPPPPDVSSLPPTSAQMPGPLQAGQQPQQQGSPKLGLPAIAQLVVDQLHLPQVGEQTSAGYINRPQSRLSNFEGFLQNFLGALGQGMSQAGSGPGSFSRGFGGSFNAPVQQYAQQQQLQQQAAQTAQENARTQQMQKQTELSGSMVTVQTPQGPAQMPYDVAVKGGYLKGMGAAEVNAQSKRYVNVAGAGLVDTQAQGGPSVVVANKQGGVEITSDMASQYNIPKQFIGSPIDLKTLATMEKAGPQTTTKLTKDPVTGLVTSTVTTKGPAQRGLPGSLGKGGAPSAPASGGATQPSGAKWDPSSVPVMLVEGTMDPSQLSKRGSTYSYYLQQADKYSRETTGKPFDIAQASSDYAFAKNVQTQNTLKYLNSLTGADGKSGNLGALIDMSNKISRTDFPAINDAAAWARLQTGDPAMASYHTAITEVADQVGKILQGGGSGAGTSDAKLKQAQEMFRVGFSKDQITGVGTTLRTLLGNRKTELIGDNRYLQRQYGQLSPAKASKSDPLGIR